MYNSKTFLFHLNAISKTRFEFLNIERRKRLKTIKLKMTYLNFKCLKDVCKDVTHKQYTQEQWQQNHHSLYQYSFINTSLKYHCCCVLGLHHFRLARLTAILIRFRWRTWSTPAIYSERRGVSGEFWGWGRGWAGRGGLSWGSPSVDDILKK